MKSIDKYVLVLVASLALLLAGCGGGSQSTPQGDGGPTAGETAIMTAKNTLATAKAAVGTQTSDEGRLAAQKKVATAASNLIDVLTANGGSAADIKAASSDLADAHSAIANLQNAIAEANKEAAASIAALLPALSLHTADGGTPARVPGHTLKTEYGKATTVTVTETPDDANAKLEDALGTKIQGSNGWSGTMVSAKDPATGNTDTVTVYTNIEAPKRVAFEKAFTLENGVLAIGTEGDQNIQSSAFKNTRTAVPQGKSNTDTTEEIRIPGTYAGAPGDYVCTESSNASCTSQGTKAGIQLAGGTWTFDPDSGAMAMKSDDTYSHFGWWLRVDDEGTYKPSVFHGITQPSDAATLAIATTLTGKANFKGPAVGKFAIAGLQNTGGHFTADASLTVDFEGGSAGNAGEISGSVTNFMAGGKEMPWRVDFNKNNLGTGGEFAGNALWTISGNPSATTADGSYAGNVRSNDDDGVPLSATGTWEAPYKEIGSMIGAFGVNRDDK